MRRRDYLHEAKSDLLATDYWRPRVVQLQKFIGILVRYPAQKDRKDMCLQCQIRTWYQTVQSVNRLYIVAATSWNSKPCSMIYQDVEADTFFRVDRSQELRVSSVLSFWATSYFWLKLDEKPEIWGEISNYLILIKHIDWISPCLSLTLRVAKTRCSAISYPLRWPLRSMEMTGRKCYSVVWSVSQVSRENPPMSYVFHDKHESCICSWLMICACSLSVYK